MSKAKQLISAAICTLTGKPITIDEPYKSFVSSLADMLSQFDYVDWEKTDGNLLLEIIEAYCQSDDNKISTISDAEIDYGLAQNDLNQKVILVKYTMDLLFPFVEFDETLYADPEKDQAELEMLDAKIKNSKSLQEMILNTYIKQIYDYYRFFVDPANILDKALENPGLVCELDEQAINDAIIDEQKESEAKTK